MAVDTRRLFQLRVLSMIEGTSTLILFGIAMPMKYFGDTPEAVTIVGSIHGALFVALVAACVWGIRGIPLGTKLGGLLMAAAVIPFGPFVVDHRLKALAPSD